MVQALKPNAEVPLSMVYMGKAKLSLMNPLSEYRSFESPLILILNKKEGTIGQSLQRLCCWCYYRAPRVQCQYNKKIKFAMFFTLLFIIFLNFEYLIDNL